MWAIEFDPSAEHIVRVGGNPRNYPLRWPDTHRFKWQARLHVWKQRRCTPRSFYRIVRA
jgi:hypothetical protein